MSSVEVKKKLEALSGLLHCVVIEGVVAAYRGPDYSQAATLKYIFTARLRYLLSGGPNPRILTRRLKRFFLGEMIEALCEARAWAERDNEGLMHYLAHVGQAFDALVEAGLHKEEARALSDLAWQIAMRAKGLEDCDIEDLARWLADRSGLVS